MEKIVIKKYENRRFYSTRDRKYVTLQEIEKYIVDGQTVQILENESEKDISGEVLSQILLQKGGFAYFPVEVLEHLIRMNDLAFFSLWGQFVGQSFQVFLQMQNNMTKAYKKIFAAFAAKK
jgi:polyhydroxyalkanoate synthesis repressor PhaR